MRYKPFYSGAASPCPVVECSMGTNGYRAELGRTLLLLTIRSYQPAFSHQHLHCPHHHHPCFLQQTQSSVRLVSRLMVTMGGQCGHSYLSSIFLFLFPVLASLIIGSKALRMGHYYVCASIELCKNTAPWCNSNGVVTKCLWPGSQSPVTGGARTRGNVCK